MKGRALIDLPAHGLRCGEYGDIPDVDAERLAQDGAFDPKAVTQPDHKPTPKRRKE